MTKSAERRIFLERCEGFRRDPASLKKWFADKLGELEAADAANRTFEGRLHSSIVPREWGEGYYDCDFRPVGRFLIFPEDLDRILPIDEEKALFEAMAIHRSDKSLFPGGLPDIAQVAESIEAEAGVIPSFGLFEKRATPASLGRTALFELAQSRPELFADDVAAKFPRQIRAVLAAARETAFEKPQAREGAAPGKLVQAKAASAIREKERAGAPQAKSRGRGDEDR